jgi:hypothetical protein
LPLLWERLTKVQQFAGPVHIIISHHPDNHPDKKPVVVG